MEFSLSLLLSLFTLSSFRAVLLSLLMEFSLFALFSLISEIFTFLALNEYLVISLFFSLLSISSGFLEISFALGDGRSHWDSEVFDIHSPTTVHSPLHEMRSPAQSRIERPFTGSKMNIEEKTHHIKPLVVLRDTDARTRMILKRLHEEVVDVHRPILNLTDIKTPKLGIYINWEKDSWFKAGVIPQPTSINFSRHVRLMMEPVKNIHLINPDYYGELPMAGGSECTMIMTEKLLRDVFGLTKPEWVEPDLYNLLVTQFTNSLKSHFNHKLFS